MIIGAVLADHERDGGIISEALAADVIEVRETVFVDFR